jgi:protein-disulfide isomerase
MREIWFVALIGLLLAGMHPAAAQAPKPGATANADKLLAVSKSDRILGKPDAPITIVEYGSLSCPHCAHFATTVLPTIKKQWIDTGKAKLVFRDFPLDQVALRAEMVARCAPPSRYYPLIDVLFANQDEWVPVPDWRPALERFAALAGIGKKEFDACLANKSVENEVAQSRLTASQQLGVDATPTFFVNGKKYEGEPSVAAFDQLLSGLAGKS